METPQPEFTAPIEIPREIAPEPGSGTASVGEVTGGDPEGVAGGVEGGVKGGVVGGVKGRAEAGPSRAEHEDVRVDPVDRDVVSHRRPPFASRPSGRAAPTP